MQNKPNFMRFSSKNSDFTKKQTQFKANLTQNKPNLSQYKAKTNPICRKGKKMNPKKIFKIYLLKMIDSFHLFCKIVVFV